MLLPKDAIAFLNRGLAYARNGLFEPAIADYDEAVRLAPNSVNAYLNRAVAYLRQGVLNKAFADLTLTMSLKPGNPRSYEIRAEAYDFLGNADAAEDDRRKADELTGKEFIEDSTDEQG